MGEGEGGGLGKGRRMLFFAAITGEKRRGGGAIGMAERFRSIGLGSALLIRGGKRGVQKVARWGMGGKAFL